MRARGARLVAVLPFLRDIIAQIESEAGRASSARLSIFLVLFAITASGADTAAPAPLALNMRRAIEIALSPEGSARIQLAEEAINQAKSRSMQARAALLPEFDATVGQQSVTRNLEAVGIRFEAPVPGFEIPTFVGPFNVFDVRTNARQTIFDLSAIRRYQASKAGVGAARAERSGAEVQVTSAVARAYLAALRADALVEATEADVGLAKEVLELAERQKRAGTGTGIEITRARVQMANQQQRLLVARNERRRSRLQLVRTVGLRLDTEIELTDKLAYVPVEIAATADAVAAAFAERADLQAQQQREDTARLNSSAASWERLPSVLGFADYGSIGTSINNALPTRSFGLSVRVPIFDGGRREARRAETRSLHRQEQVRTRDLKDQISLDVRLAIDALRSADEQVAVAKEGLSLAENELHQARRRYDAGVASGIEVTDAQTRLERARDNHVAALFNHNLARIDLAQARGNVIEVVGQGTTK
jgi:outer membrane protein TolC